MACSVRWHSDAVTKLPTTMNFFITLAMVGLLGVGIVYGKETNCPSKVPTIGSNTTASASFSLQKPSPEKPDLAADPSLPTNRPSPTDWLKDARIGAFMHYYPHDAESLKQVNDFDVEALAKQLENMGAKYFVITLGQNSGYYIAPNAAYDRITGYQPGERCATRDLPLDLYRALHSRGIRLMLYLPCQVPNRDIRAQKAFGLPEGPKDQPIDVTFAKQWAEVIREWSLRYGDKVSGWWFDGGYQRIHFNEDIAGIYADAVKSGNKDAIVTFNSGVQLIRYTQAEDYTAGETREPFFLVPKSRWVFGSQWHALTFLGSTWGMRNIREPTERWRSWFHEVTTHGGVVTFDMGPNKDMKTGPIGAICEEQAEQFRSIAQP